MLSSTPPATAAAAKPRVTGNIFHSCLGHGTRMRVASGSHPTASGADERDLYDVMPCSGLMLADKPLCPAPLARGRRRCGDWGSAGAGAWRAAGKAGCLAPRYGALAYRCAARGRFSARVSSRLAALAASSPPFTPPSGRGSGRVLLPEVVMRRWSWSMSVQGLRQAGPQPADSGGQAFVGFQVVGQVGLQRESGRGLRRGDHPGRRRPAGSGAGRGDLLVGLHRLAGGPASAASTNARVWLRTRTSSSHEATGRPRVP